MNNLHQLMMVVEKVSSLTHEVQMERGLSTGFLISKGQKNVSELPTQRQLTDKRASELKTFLGSFDSSKFSSLQVSLNAATAEFVKLEAMRGSISSLTTQPKESFTYYSKLAGLLVNVVSQVAINSTDTKLTTQATAYFNYSQTKEQNGRQRALMNAVFGTDRFEPDTYQRFLIILAAMESYNTAFQAFAPNEMKDFNKDLETTQHARDVESMKNIALGKGLSGAFGVDADAWFKAMTNKINDMKAVEDKMTAHLLAQATTLANDARTTLMIYVVILAVALILAVFLAIKVGSNLLKQLGGEPEYTASVVRKIANGDLTVQVVLKEGDTSSVLSAIKNMAEKLAQLIGDMRMATDVITKRENERKKVGAELLRFKNVLDNTLDVIYMFESESLRFVYVNQGAILSMGYSKEELLGMTVFQIKPLITEQEYRKIIVPLIEREQPSLRYETVHRRKDGTDFPVNIFLQLVKQGDGSSLFVAITRDITEKKKSDDFIWQQANFDTLTGLPNRRMLYDRLAQEIKKSHRSGLPMALLLLDLDHFKQVNDTLGHAQGDVLLVEAARRIAECVRKSDTVARLGGDEFTVILSEMEDVNSVGRIAQNIIERIAAPFQLLQESTYVSASMGITLYPNDAQDVDTLMKNADQAMYVAKNSGRNRFSYFTAVLQESAQTRMHLISDLRKALPGKQLVVYYQPIVEMASGKIHKAEALLRWQHPERGMVNPAQFIPLAEESGLIHEIGDWVFHEAARELKRWRELFVPEFQISVNKSPVQFRKDGSDCVSWPSYLRAMDLPGHSLVIEITEGLLLNAEINVTENLLAFRDAGVQVALDDFGTGYSSLSYLKKFDIDYLKIDQSFVRNLQDDPDDQALCEAIIVMAHKLGLKVIAEGVETEQQRDLLAAYGCDYAQGWLYSKAIPAGEFEALLQEQVK